MALGTITNASAASVTTGAATFALVAGQQLNLLIGGPSTVISATQSPIYGGNLVSITFAASQFANIGAATAAELVAAINAACIAQAAAGSPAAAVASGTSTVTIKTVALGATATLQILPSSTAAALTALTLTAGVSVGAGNLKVGAQPSAPVFHDSLTFNGDNSYPTGGTTGFGAKVKAFAGDGRQVLAVIGQDCGGYVPVYLPATDALKVYKSAGSAIALAEVANAVDLSGTSFNVLVISA